ncbi:MAG: conjugal transfer protein TraN [Desulfovibrionaceae bacterium]|nr:conjugal transfer protein TraN [Desulfovibrionaceae bacterium]
MSIARQAVVWLTLVCFVSAQTIAMAGPHEEGTAAGQAANPAILGTVNAGSAGSVVPGYTSEAAPSSYYGQSDLSGPANAQLAACALAPNDPVCQALLAAQTSANTPRPPVFADDPAVREASQIAANPSATLEDLASYYSGCLTTGNCPANVFCLAGSCFSTGYTDDADFARSMTFLEAAREAGVYLDPDTLQVFAGEANHCRDLLFNDCCSSNASGAGLSNQGIFGAGSRLVFDILMNSGNRRFIYQGISALLTGGGFSGSFTTYGVTVAINGSALPAGSVALYSSDGFVLAFDPWSLAITVVMYVVMSMMSCNEEEGRLALQEGAKLCHTIGKYCSSCIRVLGKCVACITYTTTKCCFNSVLARLINEQGRAQVSKEWGTARAPDCSGFTIAQLQSLDFAQMDLTEFYASIVPTLPNVGVIQDNNAARAGNCYYGEGKCQ